MGKKSKQLLDRSTVRSYRQFEELRDCLASGWSVPTVREYLTERYGAEGLPSVAAMTKWREKHLETAQRVIPHRVIQEKLKGVQFKVDIIGHLSRLVFICEERVGRGLEAEGKFEGLPLPVNDGVMATYMQVMRDWVKVAQALGIMKAIPEAPLIDARQIIMDPESAREMLMVAKEIRELEAQNGTV